MNCKHFLQFIVTLILHNSSHLNVINAFKDSRIKYCGGGGGGGGGGGIALII